MTDLSCAGKCVNHYTIEPLSPNWKGKNKNTKLNLLQGQRGGQPATHNLTPYYGRFKMTRQPNMHVFGLWEVAGVSRENLCRHEECTQTPHLKTSPKLIDSNPRPSSVNHHSTVPHLQCFHEMCPTVSSADQKQQCMQDNATQKISLCTY